MALSVPVLDVAPHLLQYAIQPETYLTPDVIRLFLDCPLPRRVISGFASRLCDYLLSDYVTPVPRKVAIEQFRAPELDRDGEECWQIRYSNSLENRAKAWPAMRTYAVQYLEAWTSQLEMRVALSQMKRLYSERTLNEFIHSVKKAQARQLDNKAGDDVKRYLWRILCDLRCLLSILHYGGEVELGRDEHGNHYPDVRGDICTAFTKGYLMGMGQMEQILPDGPFADVGLYQVGHYQLAPAPGPWKSWTRGQENGYLRHHVWLPHGSPKELMDLHLAFLHADSCP